LSFGIRSSCIFSSCDAVFLKGDEAGASPERVQKRRPAQAPDEDEDPEVEPDEGLLIGGLRERRVELEVDASLEA